jgi:hypothetical protein
LSNLLDFKIFVNPEINEILGQCKGDNQKKLFIVYESAKENTTLEAFLAKILKAVKHDIAEDVLLLRIQPEQAFSLVALCQKWDIEHCISFGVVGKRMGMHIQYPTYQPFRFHEINFLMVDELEKVEGEVLLKKGLWGGLQEMFL